MRGSEGAREKARQKERGKKRKRKKTRKKHNSLCNARVFFKLPPRGPSELYRKHIFY